MPRRHSPEAIRQKFIAAGYIPDNDFTYRNNKQKHRVYDILNSKYVHVSLQTLDYNIKKGNRPLWEEPTLPGQYTDEDAAPSRDPLSRFSRNHDEAFHLLTEHTAALRASCGGSRMQTTSSFFLRCLLKR